MEAIYTAKAVVSGGRDGVARTEDGQLELKLARPQAMGGVREAVPIPRNYSQRAMPRALSAR